MQFDIVLIIGGLFLTVGFTTLFVYFFKEIAGKIRKRFVNEVHVTVKSSVHMFDRGLFLHSIDLRLTNTTETDMRIDNLTIFDKRGRELQYVTRGPTSSTTEFDISGDETYSWSGFRHRNPTGETNRVKLKLTIESIGKRTISRNFESRLVPPERFPSGEFFFFLQLS